MAGKSINEYDSFTGAPSAVNILVQETSQGTDHTLAEHKKINLGSAVTAHMDTLTQTITNNEIDAIFG